ncbi:hypothetical protein V2K57_15800 [Pseudomonas alliivorans]|nr:hypothetical protein [Pseudomonas alliivorans]MEE4701982.1 hypothetical protein [Pseudomonas alliivorans]MEE4737839.1 hypothetical protein [Pseudomonas alliivorans]
MSLRLKRIPPRDNLCTTNDGDAIGMVHGTVVVWWYERIRGNPNAASIPMVDVVFRYLDKDDRLAGVTVIPIGVGRLGSFRIGTIWQNGQCIAEVDFGPVVEFVVDFTDDLWSYLSIPGKHNIQYLKQDHEVRRVNTDDVVSDLLNFPLPKEKNLLIPCVEFLYRCYGSTSDMARVLVTYPWRKVLETLYATFEYKDPETWAVSPARGIPDEDALFLAMVQYNLKTELAAKNLYAQLDNARARGKNETSLQVQPWFEGSARLKMRGRWINNGTTFLCVEVLGMSEPLHHSYDIRRESRSKEDPEETDTAIPLVKTTVDVDKPQDPFTVTDQLEPGGNAGSWSKPDPTFARLGPACPYTRTPIERRYANKEIKAVEVTPPSEFSVGDPQGGRNGVSHIVHRARRVIGDGGILGALWSELLHLKEAYAGFTSLAWYSEAQGFIEIPEFRLYTLKPFDVDERADNDARRWLRYPDNAIGLRGLLIIRAVIDGRTFYIFELQRKKKRKGGVFRDEQISGLSMNIDDPQQAHQVISIVCDKIRNVMGKFSKLEGLGSPVSIFRHFSHNGTFAANVTIRRALEDFNLYLPPEM